MNLIKNTIGHFKTVIIHKYWVFKYAKQIGIPWQGLIHDLSKFSWTEFSESVKFYQEGKSSPIVAAKKAQGYSLAWQHHKGRNPHHYEHWTDKYDDGTIALDDWTIGEIKLTLPAALVDTMIATGDGNFFGMVYGVTAYEVVLEAEAAAVEPVIGR